MRQIIKRAGEKSIVCNCPECGITAAGPICDCGTVKYIVCYLCKHEPQCRIVDYLACKARFVFPETPIMARIFGRDWEEIQSMQRGTTK